MIHTLEKSYEIIRTVFSNNKYSVNVCKKANSDAKVFYTALILRDKQLQSRVLQLIPEHDLKSNLNDICEIIAADSELILLFKYNTESPLFYYNSLYWKRFSDRLNVARNLLAELMSNNLPQEMLLFLLEDYNINLTSDGNIYFNYFMDLNLLPTSVSEQDVVNKAAEVVLRILTENNSIHLSEINLFTVKVQRKSYTSFAAIYSDLKLIPDTSENGSFFIYKYKRLYKKYKSKVVFGLKLAFLILAVCVSLFYAYNQWHARSLASNAEETQQYDGLTKIGTVILEEKKN